MTTTMAVAADADLVVHVYNKAGAPVMEFNDAKSRAASQMSKAGIKVRFVDCGTGNCQDSTDPRVFVLTIENKMPEGKRHVLGYALPYTELANRATLNYPKIAEASPAQTERLLGTVISHELAHLLFRSANHGPGMMKAAWTSADIRAMGEGRLSFSSEQAADLRAGLQTRLSRTTVAMN